MGTTPLTPRLRHVAIGEILFGLRERLDAADELADQAAGDPLAAQDLIATLDQIQENADVLQALGLGAHR